MARAHGEREHSRRLRNLSDTSLQASANSLTADPNACYSVTFFPTIHLSALPCHPVGTVFIAAAPSGVEEFMPKCEKVVLSISIADKYVNFVGTGAPPVVRGVMITA